ncbi:MAG TPA: glycosyl hydrolase family 28 protein [Terracidiphilus sp.]|nr:glycosyl hydrolase family 28 protein [Terracidiphilus sp.]
MLRRDFLSGAFALTMAASRNALSAPPDASKNILQYGADPGGKKFSTTSIQRAIDDTFKAGGGTVLLPSGTFLSGRIDLKSHVTLHLDEGCTLLGSTSLEDYEGSDGAHAHERHLIFAIDTEEVAIAGGGRIDGQGPSFWESSDKPPLPADEQWRAVASHDLKPKSSGRPSPMLYFVNCRGLRIEDVQIQNSPGRALNAFNCDNILIQRISVKNPVNGPNTDGIDLTGCQHAVVSNCTVETGDDAICLKSLNPYGGEPRLTKDIRVTNCTLTTCCNGFKIGTESEGGFEDITFFNSTVQNADVPFKDRVISGIALEVVDGGWIDGVTITGIQMQRTRAPIFIHMGVRQHLRENHGLRNLHLQDIQASDALMASSITGLPGTYAHDISLSDIHVSAVLPSRPDWVGQPVPEKPTQYPEAWMFGMLPASGLFARHVRNLRLSRVSLNADPREQRPTIIFDDVIGAAISEFSSTPISGKTPVVQLANCRDIRIEDSAAPNGVSTFVAVEGAGSAGIVLTGDDLRNAHKPFETSGGADKHAVTLTGNSSSPE